MMKKVPKLIVKKISLNYQKSRKKIIETTAFQQQVISIFNGLLFKSRKAKHLFTIDPDDINSLSLLYMQMCDAILEEKLVNLESIYWTLVSYMFLIEFSSIALENHKLTNEDIIRYMPTRWAVKITPSQLPKFEAEILANYNKIKDEDPNDIKYKFLELLSSNDLFMANQFEIMHLPIKTNSLEKDSLYAKEKRVLAVYSKGIIILTIAERKKIANYSFANIVKWGLKEQSTLVIETKDSFLHFIDGNAKEIDQMMMNYLLIFENKF